MCEPGAGWQYVASGEAAVVRLPLRQFRQRVEPRTALRGDEEAAAALDTAARPLPPVLQDPDELAPVGLRTRRLRCKQREEVLAQLVLEGGEKAGAAEIVAKVLLAFQVTEPEDQQPAVQRLDLAGVEQVAHLVQPALGRLGHAARRALALDDVSALIAAVLGVQLQHRLHDVPAGDVSGEASDGGVDAGCELDTLRRCTGRRRRHGKTSCESRKTATSNSEWRPITRPPGTRGRRSRNAGGGIHAGPASAECACCCRCE